MVAHQDKRVLAVAQTFFEAFLDSLRFHRRDETVC
jgi:hypothetical protein